MITDKTIRKEEFSSTQLGLKNILDEVPMTVSQRNRIDDYLYDLERTFDKANK